MWRGLRYTIYAISGIVLGGLTFEAATLPRVSGLAGQNPATTSMIEARVREAQNNGEQPKRVQIWMPLERISPQLQRAVLAGEDTNFATHHGFDYEAIQKAYDQPRKKPRRKPGRKAKTTRGCRTCLISSAAPQRSHSSSPRTFIYPATAHSCAKARKPSSLTSWSATSRRSAFWRST